MSVGIDDRLRALRSGPRSEVILVAIFVVGLLATTLHWVGLALGGVLVGLSAVSTGRAFVLGVYFGGFVLLAYAAVLAWYGTLGAVAGAFPLSPGLLAVSIGIPAVTALVARLGTPTDGDH